jgi:hypothetical protein
MLETASYGSPGSLTIICSGLAARRDCGEIRRCDGRVFPQLPECRSSLPGRTYGSKPRRVSWVSPDLTTIGEDAQDCILGYSQPSLRDWSVVSNLPRTDVLGYSQPSPSTSSGQALRDWSVAEPNKTRGFCSL